MMSQQSLLNSLEAWVQEEIGARRRMLGLIERQEEAVRKGRGADLERATRDVEAELATQADRALRRTKLFAAFGALWGVVPEALTLSSICERWGAGAQRLEQLHKDLREATARVVKKNRRLASLMTLHQRVVEDLIGTLMNMRDATALARSGTLVDAEA